MEGIYFGFPTLKFMRSKIYLMDTWNSQIVSAVYLLIRWGN